MKTPVIGLTGGLASGKSLVAKYLAELGALLIDSDVLSREVVALDTNARNAMRLRWPDVFNRSGELNRDKLAKIIFADKNEREALNEILHPPIIKKIKELLDQPRSAPAVVVIPLLIEANLFGLVNEIWVVWCKEEQQIKRLMLRDKLTEEEARLRLTAQIPLNEKIKYAKVVICNDKDPEETKSQVEFAWKRFDE